MHDFAFFKIPKSVSCLIFGYFQKFTYLVLSCLDDLFVLVVVLTLWACARNFSLIIVQYIRDHEEGEMDCVMQLWIKIEQHYTALRKLSSLINNFFGNYLALFLISEILYYSTKPNKLFAQQRESDLMTVLRVSLYSSNPAAILFFAANIGS